MEYFTNPWPMKLFRNSIQNDSLCDWFEIQNYKYSVFTKDIESIHKKHINVKSSEYKKKVFSYIENVIGNPVEKCKDELDTINKINNNHYIIANPILHNKEFNCLVSCDLLVNVFYFNKLFPELENIDITDIDTDTYCIINIVYPTLHFKKDKTEVNTTENNLYKKCELVCFDLALKNITQRNTECFLWGKEYYYKKELLPKHKYISQLLDKNKFRKILQSTCKWLHYLRKTYDEINNISPKPLEMYPNMNYKDSNWENEKKKIAEEKKEITLLWQISFKERCRLYSEGIVTWDDPRLLYHLKEGHIKETQERMIHMKINKDVIVYPRKTISYDFQTLLEYSNSYFFDVESLLSFDQKQELSSGELLPLKPIIAIMGIVDSNKKYKGFTLENYSSDSEVKIIKDFFNYIESEEKTILFHWGNAEKAYINYIQKRYPEIKIPNIELVDLLYYFKKEPIVIQGIFSFGLKHVAKHLYNHGLIQTTWDDYDNGLDSMIIFQNICQNHSKNIPLKRVYEIKQIIDYNEVDCQVLYEIVSMLKNRYL